MPSIRRRSRASCSTRQHPEVVRRVDAVGADRRCSRPRRIVSVAPRRRRQTTSPKPARTPRSSAPRRARDAFQVLRARRRVDAGLAVEGHAVAAFWRWVASWGAVVKRPNDLGHDDAGFALPPLRMHDHVVASDHADVIASGRLFADTAMTLADQQAVRRASIAKRAAIAAKLCEGNDPALVWCELNDEGDALAAAIPDAVQVAGADDRETKTERLVGFSDSRYRVMINKPSLAGFGLNWQHCNKVIFVGASHSYEQTYQAIRRCWRFGQTRPVDVHVIRTDSDEAIVQNMRRKVADADRMSAEMIAHVGDAVRAAVRRHRARVEPLSTTRASRSGSRHGSPATRIDPMKVIDQEVAEQWALVPRRLRRRDARHARRQRALQHLLRRSRLCTRTAPRRATWATARRTRFYEQYQFAVAELFRITKPGRLMSFHCMNRRRRSPATGSSA